MSGFIIGTLLKKLTLVIISVIIAISTFFGGNSGEYSRLSVKPLTFENNILSDFSLKLTLSPEAVYFLTGTDNDEEKIYEKNFTLCVDKDELKFALLDNDGRELLICDSTGLALSGDFTTSSLALAGEDYLSAYNRYFPGKAFYSDFDELIPYDALSFEQLDYIRELQKSDDELDFLSELLKSKESISQLAELSDYTLKSIEKYYGKREIDGITGYSFKMSVEEYFEYLTGYSEYTKSEEYTEGIIAFSEHLVFELSKIYPRLSPEKEANIKEEMRKALSALDENDTLLSFAKAIASEDTDSLGELAVLLPYIKNSFAEAMIYEKDSAIYERTRFVISDGKKELAVIECSTKSMNSGKEIPASEEFAAFESRVSFEQIDCKRAYEKARSEKISGIDISWASTMAQNYSVPYISDTNFTINYLLGDIDDTDTVAYLLDGSIYLPLRKIMEYAGYDVSWDNENRKAYVIVDANPVDMTGVLIDNKTYVKIRDFEKLGATVNYEESFLYNNAYNDFQKECCANIVFTK